MWCVYFSKCAGPEASDEQRHGRWQDAACIWRSCLCNQWGHDDNEFHNELAACDFNWETRKAVRHMWDASVCVYAVNRLWEAAGGGGLLCRKSGLMNMASVCSLLPQPEFGGLSIWAYFSMKHKTPSVLLCGVCLILNVYEVKSFFSFIFIRNICYISFVSYCFSYLAFKINYYWSSSWLTHLC